MNNDTARPMSVDGFRPRLTPQAAASPTPATQSRPPAARRVYSAARPAAPTQSRFKKLELPLLLLAGTLGGFFADNLVLGLGLLTVYGIFAFVAKISSRTTFTLALLLLAAISLLLLFKPNLQLIGNFATYAFVLLLIGVITIGKEAKMPKRMPRKYRR